MVNRARVVDSDDVHVYRVAPGEDHTAFPSRIAVDGVYVATVHEDGDTYALVEGVDAGEPAFKAVTDRSDLYREAAETGLVEPVSRDEAAGIDAVMHALRGGASAGPTDKPVIAARDPYDVDDIAYDAALAELDREEQEPVLVADGGEERRDASEETLKDVDHTPPNASEGAARVWDGTRVRPYGEAEE